MKLHIRRSILSLLPLLTFANPLPVYAQQAPTALIESAARAHAAFQKKGGMQAVNAAIAECWQTNTAQASFDSAVFCSALNFTAANFDAQFLRLLENGGYNPPRKPLSMADARVRAKRALLIAGVSQARLPTLMDDIQRQAIAATERQF